MKFCKNCGKELPDEAVVCSACGVSQGASAGYVSNASNSAADGLAKASKICGIIGLFCVTPASVVAIILGAIAKSKGYRGSAGIVTGVIGAIIGVIAYIIIYASYFAMLGSYYY